MIWGSGSPASDALIEKIERAYAEGDDFHHIDSLTDRLMAVARQDLDNRLVMARAHYFKARLLSSVGSYADSDQSEAADHAEKARQIYSLIDAPDYDLFRLKYTSGKISFNSLSDIYTLNKEILEESISFGDSLSMAGALNNIGNTLIAVGDTVGAIPYMKQSAAIFHKMNLPIWEAKINLSIASAYQLTEPAKSVAIMKSLYSNPLLERDSDFRMVLLHNMAVKTQNIDYFKEICRLTDGKPEYNNTRAVCFSHIALHLFESPHTSEEALFYADSAAEAMTSDIRDDYAASIYRAMALAARMRGDNDSAYIMLDKYATSTRQATDVLLEGDVMRKENLSRIKRMEAHQRDQDNYNKLIFVSVIFSIAILALLSVMMVYRHNKRLQVSKMKADLELTRNRLQLASSRLALEENDNAMERAIDTIAELRDSDRISRADANVMSSALRAQLSNREELDAFQEIYNRLDPDFSRRLKELCPNLSEGQIRMAAYIALGMNNRQIGRVMSIEYESVIKARYRLRSRLGLKKADSLEDFLRSLTTFDAPPAPEE